MIAENVYYQEERKFAAGHLFILIFLTLAAFFLSLNEDKAFASKMLMAAFVLLAADVINIIYYIFISMHPNILVSFRKILLLVFDIALLTYFVYLFEYWGLFLLPLYALIVIHSGLGFGISYFYIASGTVIAAWAGLFVYSPYWTEHRDIIVSFGIVTFVIPLFYLKYIIHFHQENYALDEMPDDKEYDNVHDELTGVASRKAYKEKIQTLLQNKTPFSLLFIEINKLQAIQDNYGRHIAEELLKEAVSRIKEYMEEDDFIARLGDSELVIVTTRKKIFMDKFLAKLERFVIGRHKVGNIVVPIDLSIGISIYPDDAHSAMLLGKFADMAMFAAKEDKERHHYFYHELDDEIKEVFALR
jgi:diguanylate cyclase (GGDEF)-like protein